MNGKSSVLGCLVPLLSGCALSFGPKVWVEDRQDLAPAEGAFSALSCQTHNGSITVRESPGDAPVRVAVTLRGGGKDALDAADCLAAIRIVSEEAGGHLRLGWEWSEPERSSWSADVSFEIQAPRAMRMDLNTHNGSISHRCSSAGVRAETHNGTIDVESDAAEVFLKTHNGPIEARLGSAGSLGGHIETHNGGIMLRLGPEANCQIQAETHNGRIRCEHPEAAALKSDGDRLSARIGAGGETLRVVTHNGAVQID